MKLLSPQQAQANFKAKQGGDITQIAYLDETLKRLQNRINVETTNFDKKRQEQQNIYSAEKEALQAELRHLEACVSDRRAELENSMIPIETLKADAQEMHDNAQIRLREIEARTNDINDTMEVIQAKLDDIASREAILKDEETKLASRIQGAKDEAQMIVDGHRKLNKLMATFKSEAEVRNRELAAKESAVAIREKMLQDHNQAVQKELMEGRAELRDKRLALEREINRLQANKQ